MRTVFVLAAVAAFASSSAFAAGDPRIRTVVYAPERVIPLIGHFGYQIAIEFPAGEQIENVAIGDSLAWQATPNRRGDVLFLKPVDLGDPTNLTVMTQTRRYSFELDARRRTAETPISEITYVLKIRAPKAEEPATRAVSAAEPLIETRDVNTAYTYSGSTANLPARVYDDGATTSFEWPKGAQTPAIFVAGPDGKEVIVNFSYAGERILVHQVAERFVLRNGSQVTYLYNEGYAPPAPGPDAPQERKKKSGFLFFGGGDS